MTYHNLLFILTVLFAVWAVMSRNLLTSAIMLALVSVFASIILFDFSAPWAGVFELSVCAGLITVLFISGVSLVRAEHERNPEGRAVFQALPLVLDFTSLTSILVDLTSATAQAASMPLPRQWRCSASAATVRASPTSGTATGHT